LKQDWHAIESATPELRKDRDFMLQAIETNRDAIPYVALAFHEDAQFWVGLLKSFPDGVALFIEFYGEGELQADIVLMRELCKKDWRAFQTASIELRADESLQLVAVCQCWEAVAWANSVQLKVMKECVQQAWRSVELFLDPDGPRENGFLSDADRQVLASGNPDIVQAKALADDHVLFLAAVCTDGLVLKFASRRITGMREIVRAAIRQNWQALQYASDELRGDRKLVTEAFKQSGLALKYATEALRCDHSVVMEAIMRNRKALALMSKKLYKDSAFWEKVCNRFPDGWSMAHQYGISY